MWRVFDTLSSRGFAIPTLRSRWSLSMGFLRDVATSRHSSNEFGSALDFATLLRFSIFEAAKKSVFYQTRAKTIKIIPGFFIKNLRIKDFEDYTF